MNRVLRSGLLLAALAGVGAIASGCADDKMFANDQRQANDFGRAVGEDLAAQIADPDAAYKGPPPPSSGERAALAQQHYGTDTVKQPVAATTSSTGGGGSGGGGGGGGGGSTGGGSGGP
jgi:hypothetical protein